MNKVININLGGYAFTIDEDAYQYLDNYVRALKNHFSASKGHEEIIGDVESRLAELFREAMGGRTIVDLRNVKNAVSVMGKPEDFGAEPVEEPHQAASGTGPAFGSTFGSQTGATGKRLFRDPENKKIAGVCSGLAAYFGIADPIWVRILFAVLFFGGGVGFPLYIVLIILMPKAKTTADRLAMRGEPATVETIAKSVEEGVNNLKETIAGFSAKTERSFKDGSARKNFEGAASRVGELITGIIRAISHLARPIIIIVGFVLIVAFLIGWIASAIGIAAAYPFLHFMGAGSGAFSWVGVVNIAFLFLIPVVSLIFMLRRLTTGKRLDPLWKAGLWVFFTINAISLSIFGVHFAKQWAHRSELTENVPLRNPAADKLTILANERSSEDGDFNMQFGYVSIDGDDVLSRNVNLKIVKTADAQFSLSRQLISNGPSTVEAKRIAAAIEYQPVINGDTIRLSNRFSIPKDAQWRNQRVNLTLNMPVGKTISIYEGENKNRMNLNMDFVEDGECDGDGVRTYKMTADGLKCQK